MSLSPGISLNAYVTPLGSTQIVVMVSSQSQGLLQPTDHSLCPRLACVRLGLEGGVWAMSEEGKTPRSV